MLRALSRICNKSFLTKMFMLQILLLSLFVINRMTQTAESTTCINNNIQRSNVIVNPDGTRGSLKPIDLIRNDCGELCNTSRRGESGPYFDHVMANINCEALFRNEYIDSGHGLAHAPKEIPKELMDEYTMNGRVGIKKWYFDEQYLGKKAFTPIWTEEMIEKNIKQAKAQTLFSPYGLAEINALRDGLKHAPGIQDGRVLVIGSERPWAEACVLEAGAREILTLEYGKIISTHPKVKTIVPLDFRMRYLNNTLGAFDAVVTFSSVEQLS